MVENDFYMNLNLSMLSFYENERREAVVVAQLVSLKASVRVCAVPVSQVRARSNHRTVYSSMVPPSTVLIISTIALVLYEFVHSFSAQVNMGRTWIRTK